MKKAVIVGLSGGLGNQMFQYAAGRALAQRLDVPLRVDLSWFRSLKGRPYALEPFAISATPCDADKFMPATLRPVWNRIARRWLPRRMGLPVFRERHYHFDPEILRIERPTYLDGYWQSERNFPGCAAVLAAEFSLWEKLPETCLALEDKISSSDSICVHVRRGDYVTNSTANETHGLCSMDYYRRGIEHVARGLRKPHVFVFSDDPEFIRREFVAGYPVTIVDSHTPAKAHLDLHLMSKCHYFVIANSSLSWWGAWLGKFPSKRVVAPLQWFKTTAHDTRDLIPSGWARL